MHLVHLSVSVSISVCCCILLWDFHSVCTRLLPKLSAFPPALSNSVIDNRRKGEDSADKEAECADQSIQRQKEPGVWAEARVQRK